MSSVVGLTESITRPSSSRSFSCQASTPAKGEAIREEKNWTARTDSVSSAGVATSFPPPKSVTARCHRLGISNQSTNDHVLHWPSIRRARAPGGDPEGASVSCSSANTKKRTRACWSAVYSLEPQWKEAQNESMLEISKVHASKKGGRICDVGRRLEKISWEFLVFCK